MNTADFNLQKGWVLGYAWPSKKVTSTVIMKTTLHLCHDILYKVSKVFPHSEL